MLSELIGRVFGIFGGPSNATVAPVVTSAAIRLIVCPKPYGFPLGEWAEWVIRAVIRECQFVRHFSAEMADKLPETPCYVVLAGLAPVPRRLATLPRRSNQKGAPRLTAAVVK